MADKTIPDLQLRSEFSDNCLLPVDDSTQSYRVSALQIFSYFQTKGMVSSYDSLRIYGLNDFVTYNGVIYCSLQTNNSGNTPSSSFAYWLKAGFSAANIRTSEGTGTTTLTNSDNPHQIFNLSAARTCVLPTTGVLAGQVVRLENRTNFALTVQASGGQDLTIANSANLDATINIGHVILTALQAAPTTAAHWRVSSVSDRGGFTATPTGAVTNTITFNWIRQGARVTLSAEQTNATASSSSNISVSAIQIPGRLTPSISVYQTCTVRNSGVPAIGYVRFNSDGSLSYWKMDATNFSGNSSVSNGANSVNSFTYSTLD